MEIIMDKDMSILTLEVAFAHKEILSSSPSLNGFSSSTSLYDPHPEIHQRFAKMRHQALIFAGTILLASPSLAGFSNSESTNQQEEIPSSGWFSPLSHITSNEVATNTVFQSPCMTMVSIDTVLVSGPSMSIPTASFPRIPTVTDTVVCTMSTVENSSGTAALTLQSSVSSVGSLAGSSAHTSPSTAPFASSAGRNRIQDGIWLSQLCGAVFGVFYCYFG
jgi:hypothetical protein